MSEIYGKKNPLTFDLLNLPPFLNRFFIKITPVGNFIAYPIFRKMFGYETKKFLKDTLL
jgi:hypothetical protein